MICFLLGKKVKLGNWNLPVEWRTSEFCHRLHPKELLLYVSDLVKGRLNIQFMYEEKSEQFFAEHNPRMHGGTRVFLNREKRSRVISESTVRYNPSMIYLVLLGKEWRGVGVDKGASMVQT
jgi:hypothetical protein